MSVLLLTHLYCVVCGQLICLCHGSPDMDTALPLHVRLAPVTTWRRSCSWGLAPQFPPVGDLPLEQFWGDARFSLRAYVIEIDGQMSQAHTWLGTGYIE